MAAARLTHSYGIAVLACILFFSNGVESAPAANSTSNNGESTSTTTSGSTSTAASVLLNTVASASDSNASSATTALNTSSLQAPSLIMPRTLSSSSGINPVTFRSLSNGDGNTSENSSRTLSSTTTAFSSPTTSTSTTSIKSSPGTKFSLPTGAPSIVKTVAKIKHSRGTTITTTFSRFFSSTTSSSTTFLATPPSTYILSDVTLATSTDLSLSSTPSALSAVATSSSSRFWNNRAAVIEAFVIIALIEMVVIGICLFAVFKKCNAHRRFRHDVFPHSPHPSSTTTPLNAISQKKDSSNVPRDVSRLSLFPFLIRQSKRASTPSIKSFFSPTPQPQLSNMTAPLPQEMGSSAIPDVLPDIPFSFWFLTSSKRESSDSFFGGPVLQSRPF